jgi:hypothetical protein
MSEEQKPPPAAPPVQQPDYSTPTTYTHPQQSAPQGSFTSLIPTNNPPALIAYYVGIFSMLPVACVVLGPIALVLGIKGLKAYQANPQISGKAHAWIGIVLGGLSTLVAIILAIGIAYGSMQKP